MSVSVAYVNAFLEAKTRAENLELDVELDDFGNIVVLDRVNHCIDSTDMPPSYRFDTVGGFDVFINGFAAAVCNRVVQNNK